MTELEYLRGIYITLLLILGQLIVMNIFKDK